MHSIKTSSLEKLQKAISETYLRTEMFLLLFHATLASTMEDLNRFLKGQSSKIETDRWLDKFKT